MKGGFYSYVVFLPYDELPLPEAKVLLERGVNAFNAVISDPEAFDKNLAENGVRIIKKSCLDETTHEPSSINDLALPAEHGPHLLGEDIASGVVVPSEAGASDSGRGSVLVDGNGSQGHSNGAR